MPLFRILVLGFLGPWVMKQFFMDIFWFVNSWFYKIETVFVSTNLLLLIGLCLHASVWLKYLDTVQDRFGVRDISENRREMMAAVYLQVSIISQALIFVTRSRSWSFVERPGALLMFAFVAAQLVRCLSGHVQRWNTLIILSVCFFLGSLNHKLSWFIWTVRSRMGAHIDELHSFSQVATFIAVYANWGFARIRGCGWGWAGVVWLFSIVTYIPLDILKFAVRYIQSGKAWDNLINQKVWDFFSNFINLFVARGEKFSPTVLLFNDP